MRKAIAVMALAATLATTTVFAEGNINDLQGKIQDSEQKTGQLQTQLAEVQKQIADLKAKLAAIGKQIEATDAQIKNAEAQLLETGRQIDKNTEDIRIGEIDMKGKQDILAKNLRVMYAKGESSYLEFLFNSQNVSDFLYRFDSLKDVTKANKQLYEEVRGALQRLNDKKAELQVQKASQESQKKGLEGLKSQQTAQKQEQLSVLAELSKKEASIENNIEEEKAAIADMNAQIAEIIRKREEERKRQEEERRKAEEAKKQPPAPDPSYVKGSGVLSMPVAEGTYVRSSGFGYRSNPMSPGSGEFHNGVDFAAPVGTPIYAADDGYVLFARPARGFGNWVVIDHGGLYTIYGHMYGNGIYVSEGQTVKKGQKIASVGSAGSSTGAHLHFGVSTNFDGSSFVYVNPDKYLP